MTINMLLLYSHSLAQHFSLQEPWSIY